MSQLFDFFSLSYLMETRALWMLSAVSVQCTGSGGVRAEGISLAHRDSQSKRGNTQHLDN